MWAVKPIDRCFITPSAFVIFAVFFLLSDFCIFSAVTVAILCHEAGHIITLKCFHNHVKRISIGAFGAEMLAERSLSYGKEFLAILAGPGTNIVLFFLLSLLGRWLPSMRLFAGAQLLLGVFNLLPVQPLDGGSLLWTLCAWLTEPFTADRVTSRAGVFFSAIVLLFSCGLVCHYHRGTFLLWGAFGLLIGSIRYLGLVK